MRLILSIIAALLLAGRVAGQCIGGGCYQQPNGHPVWNQPSPALAADTMSTLSAAVRAAVVRIRVPEGNAASLGSGVVVAVEGNVATVLTAHHVIRDSRGTVIVAYPSGAQGQANVLADDPVMDVCALRAQCKPGQTFAPLAEANPQRGARLTACGYGSSSFGAFSGPVLGYTRPQPGGQAWWLVVGCRVRQGDSGGPIFTESGETAGILWGTGAEQVETLGTCCGRIRQWLGPRLPNCPPPTDRPPVVNEPPLVTVPPRQLPPSNEPELTPPLPSPPIDLSPIIARLDKLEQLVQDVASRPSVPGPPGAVGPPGPVGLAGKDGKDGAAGKDLVEKPSATVALENQTKLSHFALVGDEAASWWPRVEGHLHAALAVFPKIHRVERAAIPFDVEAPAMVAYDTKGVPISIARGQSQVESLLQRISRKEL